MSDLEHVIAARGYLPRWLFDRVLAGEDPTTPISRRAAVLMVDMAGFSELTNRLAAEGRVGPEATLEHLNRWFGRVIAPVQKQGGDVVSFGGDCFTAIFDGGGMEEDTRRAALAAFAVQDSTEEPTHVGISHGTVKLGVAGSEKIRRPYALGDCVSGAAEAMGRADPGTVWFHGDPADLPIMEKEGALVRLAPPAAGLEERARPAKRLGSGDEPTSTASIGDPRVMSRAFARLRPLLPEEVWDALLLPSVPGEHAVVTSLFLRVDASSPEEAEQMLSEALPVILSAGGYVNKIDSAEKGVVVLAFFGAPRGIEDAAARALESSLSLVRRGPLAAALTTGRLFIGDLGSTTRHEFTSVGAPVNRAARILQSTPSGEVWCDHATASEATGFRFRDGPRVAARGFAEPLSTIVLEGERGHGGGLAADPLPLIGREEELGTFQRYLDGPGSSPLILEGSMGMGKSRLLREFALVARSSGREVAYGVFGIPRPFAALGRIAESLGLPPADDRDALLKALAARLARLGSSLVLLLDDAHLASEDDRSLWRALEKEACRAGTRVLIAGRPGQSMSESDTRLVIGPLSSAASVQIVRRINPRLDWSRALALTRLAEGNALFLERLARQSESGEEGLPPTVEAAVKARFNRLPASARRVLEAGAVWGSSFGREPLFALLSEVNEVELSSALELLQAGGFLFTADAEHCFTHEIERAVAYDSLSLSRVRMLHRAALDLLSRRSGVDPLEILPHAKGAGDEELWVKLAVEAAESAIERRFGALASRISLEAREHIQDPRLLVRLDAVEIRAIQLAGNHLEAARLLPEAIEKAREAGLLELLVKLNMRLAETASQTADYETSENAIVAGLSVAAGLPGIRDIEGALLRVRGWNAWGRGDYRGAEHHLADALRKVEPDGFAAVSIRVALTAVRNYLGDFKGALAALPDLDGLDPNLHLPVILSHAGIAAEQAKHAQFQQGLVEARLLLSTRGEGSVYSHLLSLEATALERGGRFAEASRLREEAIEEHRKAGRRYDALYDMVQVATGALIAGRLPEAIRLAKELEEEAGAVGADDEAARGETLGHIAACLAGDPPPRERLFDLEATAKRTGRFDLIVVVGVLRALIVRSSDEREAEFRSVLALCEERNGRANERFVRIVRWRYLEAIGADYAQERLLDVRRCLEDWGCPRWTWREAGA